MHTVKLTLSLYLVGLLLITIMSAPATTLSECSLEPLGGMVSVLKDESVLSRYELALLIDRSHSMCKPCLASAPDPQNAVPVKADELDNKQTPDEFGNRQTPDELVNRQTPEEFGNKQEPAELGHRQDSDELGNRQNSDVSRWHACMRIAQQFAEQGKDLYPAGLNVTTFSESAKTFQGLGIEKLEDLFKGNAPSGATYAAGPIRKILQSHFKKLESENGHCKPLLIAILTDGHMNDGYLFRRAILDATKKMSRGDQVLIVILQIGEDEGGTKCLQKLSQKLLQGKALFDIVEIRPYSDLAGQGLLHTLADVIRTRQSFTAAAGSPM